MRTDSMVVLAVLILAVVLVASYLFVNYRERACADHCQTAGYAGYDYKSFSGLRLALNGDTCKCTNVGSFNSPQHQ